VGRERESLSNVLHVGRFTVAVGAALFGLGGCVGGNGSLVDAGSDSGPGCFDCGGGCFDCGSGCQCGVDGGDGNWVSPFSNTGDDGTWGVHTSPLCTGVTQVQSTSLWSDARGIYLLVTGLGATQDQPAAERPMNGDQDPPAGGAGGVGAFGGTGGIGGFGGGQSSDAGVSVGGCDGSGCPGHAIYFNDGVNGWQRPYTLQDNTTLFDLTLRGLPNGSLFEYGGQQEFTGLPTCTLRRVDSEHAWTCERSGREPSAFFAVSSALAYASIGADLVRFDGSAWAAYGPSAPGDIAQAWASEDQITALSFQGEVSSLRGDTWTRDASAPFAQRMWGNAANDLWFVDTGNQLIHFDGATSTLIADLGQDLCGNWRNVLGIWGSGDSVFIYTASSIQRWNGTALETLADWSCTFNDGAIVIQDVWGNGPNEVFLAVNDFTRSFGTCGETLVVYFDGNQFHRL